jgi:hypothetical protein
VSQPEVTEDKPTLARKRAEIAEALAGPLPAEDRVRLQAEISVINAKIKALNITESFRLKQDANVRKVAGLAEAKANAVRAQSKIKGAVARVLDKDEDEEDDDPGQTKAIDGWIDALLMRCDVDFSRDKDGTLTVTAPSQWYRVIMTLIEGVNAAARGQELPDLPSVPKTAKTKKRS